MNVASILMASGYGPFGDGISPMATEGAAGENNQENDAVSKGVAEILGKDAFLQLLTTQLRYQDPMQPVEDQDFIAQMAQFSALEQMQNLSRAMERFIAEERATNQMARATGLLGHVVDVQGVDEIHTGKVEAIRMVEGLPRLVVNGATFEVGDVLRVLVDEEA